MGLTSPQPVSSVVPADPASHSRLVRSREESGWEAEAPAPQERRLLRTKVGQTLSSVAPSRLLSVRDMVQAKKKSRPFAASATSSPRDVSGSVRSAISNGWQEARGL